MEFQLAQLNIARLRHPLDDPRIQEFVEGLEPINQLAEQSPGFVWRLKTDSGNATGVRHPWSDDPFALVNMSVWENAADLRQFVYRTEHLAYYLKRAEWFERPTQAGYVLWWIPKGDIPSLEEACGRLEHYQAHGASPHAFWFGRLYPAPALPTPAAR